jgi:hypothetical protein
MTVLVDVIDEKERVTRSRDDDVLLLFSLELQSSRDLMQMILLRNGLELMGRMVCGTIERRE